MESMMGMVNQQIQALQNNPNFAPYPYPNPFPMVPPGPNPNPNPSKEEDGKEKDKDKGSLRLPGLFFKGLRPRPAPSPPSPPSPSQPSSDNPNNDNKAVNNAAFDAEEDRDGNEMAPDGQRAVGLFFDLKLEPPRDLTLRQQWHAMAEDEVAGRILRANRRLLVGEMRRCGLQRQPGAIKALVNLT